MISIKNPHSFILFIKILEKFKNFSPAKLSQPQIIIIPEIFNNFLASKQYSSSNRQSFSNEQRQPTASSIPAATSNHSAINSSNQQQRSTAATSNSKQQQQPAAAINSSNRQQQLAFIQQPALTQPPATVRQAPARLTTAPVSYHYGS